MMMSFDRTPTPPSPSLSPDTINSLRSVLSDSAARGEFESSLETILHQVADESRTKGIAAEGLLVVLKDLWFSLPEVSTASSPNRQHALLQQLVSRCILAYYST